MTLKNILIISMSVIVFVGGYSFTSYYSSLTNTPKETSAEQHIDTSFLSELEHSKTLAEEWTVNDLNDAGFFRYVYDPEKNSWDTSRNNMIRQLMSTRGLAIIAQEDESVLSLHKKNVEYVIENWVTEEDDYAYVYFRKKAKIGAFAMFVRAMVESPYFNDYEDITRKVAESILKLQKENGEFSAWLIAPDYEYDEDYLLTFYSGEAILALVEYYKKTGETKYLDSAVKAQDAYLIKYVDEIEEHYYPAYVPWHVMSLYHLYTITGEKKYADAGIFLTDKVLELQDVTGNENTHGRFYNPDTPEYGSPHSSSDSVYTEGLAYAYEIAKLVGDTEKQHFYKDRLRIASKNLMNLQFQYGKMRGAIMARYNKSEVRIDNVQHTIDAFNAILDFEVFE